MIVSPETLPRMSAGQYLDYEQTQEIRHELVDGYLYAIVGASDRHEEIAMNLAAALSLHLRGGPCRVYKSDLKLRIGDDFYYPDIFVRCGTERGDPWFKTDPVLIVEVLSPTTQRYDRGDKRQAYLSLPSLRDYILISQTEMKVWIEHSGTAKITILDAPDDNLVISGLEFSISLRELYA